MQLFTHILSIMKKDTVVKGNFKKASLTNFVSDAEKSA